MAENFNFKMLKKRHLENVRPVIGEDFMAMDDIPDIVHCAGSRETGVHNYKATTILNTGSLLGDFKPVVVDFASSDVAHAAFR
jgi:hypothetical protein